MTIERDKLSKIVTSDLAEARDRAGITQHGLAERCSLSRSHIAMIETGAREIPVDLVDEVVEAIQNAVEERQRRREQIRGIVERLNPWTEEDAERLALARRIAELELVRTE